MFYSYNDRQTSAGGIANYITAQLTQKPLSTEAKAIICLFVKLSQEIHNIMPMLPSEETMLMTARIL